MKMFRSPKILLVIVAITCLSIAHSAYADTFIPNAYLWGTGGAAHGSGGADSRSAHNTINGGGNNGTTNDVNASQMWLRFTSPVAVEWALPRNFDLSDIHVWNYNEASQNHDLRNVDISVATSLGGSYTSLGTFVFPAAPGTVGYTGFAVSSLGGWAAQSNVAKIRFTPAAIDGSYSNSGWGLSEVKFVTPNALSTAPTALVTPLSGVTIQGFSSQFGGRVATNTVDGSGLTGPLHNSDESAMWETSSADGGNPHITYDLSGAAAGAQSLGKIRIWNYGSAGNDIEASHIRVLVSPDSDPSNLEVLGEFQAFGRNDSQIVGGGANFPSYDLDFTSLTSSQLALLSNVELVRLQILSFVRSLNDFDNGGGVTNLTGFSEVQFFNQEEPLNGVPEPSTYALGLIGLAGLGVLVWRRRRQGK